MTPDAASTIPLGAIALRETRLPLRAPFRTSSGIRIERRVRLPELRDADGVEAWAECVAPELLAPLT